MRYGYFDDAKKEYVVERPDTPRSWSNYSGSREYGAIITNNAGGYSFYRSSAIGRHLRLRFNSVPMDQPGRYFYLRDRKSGDYWSASWQPVGKPLDKYTSTCRFGTSYTKIQSRYSDIATETTYFVPLEQSFEYWMLSVHNQGKRARTIDIFTFCEFSSEWNIFQDHFNIQYSAHCAQTEWRDGMIRHSSLNNVKPDPENFANGDQGRWCWMTLLGSKVTGHELDRETFLGPYRSFHNPRTVEEGRCRSSIAWGDNAVGCIQTTLELKPGEKKNLLVMLGIGKAEAQGAATVKSHGTFGKAREELRKVKEYWHSRLGAISANTPDANFNHMVNVWNAYNALITFSWSRSASLVYTGDSRDGFGYRDTVQDLLGAIPLITGEVKQRLELMLTGQESTGGARPEIKAWLHKPGHMPPTPSESYRSDDALWLFNTVQAYVAETADVGFYDKVLPYADKGEATVFGHLRRALEFNLERTGAHGLACGLLADWNDCLKLGFKGESVFVTFQVRYGLRAYADLATQLNRPHEAAWAVSELVKLDKAIQDHTWDGEWFIRGYRDDGSPLGASRCEEGRIFLEPQCWSVISGAADSEQATTLLDAMERHLATDYGLMICSPAFAKIDHDVVRAVLLNPGQKENGGIFSHTQSWAVIAEALMGNGDRAYRYYSNFMPAAFNDRAEIRQVEPYVHCQSTDSAQSPRTGVSHIPWLSGTASWAYYTATQYILGIRPTHDGLVIDPCIPSSWKKFSVRRVLRGKRLHIDVRNPMGVQKGVQTITVDGRVVTGNFVPEEMLRRKSSLTVVMG